ncbi:DUF6350 family protein [Streptomyces sp. NPDC090022]|uniref:cell division protein PerM n=1 Tax=Streptomyces sp. NPDC090022 TaxID=3365920 RepID=UPI00381354B4
MTQVTERGTSLPALPRSGGRRRSPAAAACVLSGVVAAGLGLGFLAVLVMTLWISSPYPDSGPGGALHLAAGLWLMAHGTELIRYDTLSGAPAPVGVTPLLLLALPVLLTRRAARLATDDDDALPAGAVFSAVMCGYLAVGAAATVYAAGGPMPADPLSAAWHVPLVTAAAAGGGVWAARGRPRGPLPAWVPEGVRRAVARPRYALALGAGGAGALVLVGGGALLLGASLVWHAQAAQESFTQLTGVWSGRFAVLLLAVGLIPNAAVWGAAYGLGPGFELGTGAVATPLGFEGSPALPHFPLLAALPPAGAGATPTWAALAALAVPVVAGLVVGWFAVRRAREVSLGETALTAALGAVVCGLLLAGLAGASGGALGSGELARFGPVWWQAGAAAAGWTLALAVPVAVAVHRWRTRPSFAPEPADDDWHTNAGREARWAALRRTSGTLIPDLTPPAEPVPPVGVTGPPAPEAPPGPRSAPPAPSPAAAPPDPGTRRQDPAAPPAPGVSGSGPSGSEAAVDPGLAGPGGPGPRLSGSGGVVEPGSAGVGGGMRPGLTGPGVSGLRRPGASRPGAPEPVAPSAREAPGPRPSDSAGDRALGGPRPAGPAGQTSARRRRPGTDATSASLLSRLGEALAWLRPSRSAGSGGDPSGSCPPAPVEPSRPPRAADSVAAGTAGGRPSERDPAASSPGCPGSSEYGRPGAQAPDADGSRLGEALAWLRPSRPGGPAEAPLEPGPGLGGARLLGPRPPAAAPEPSGVPSPKAPGGPVPDPPGAGLNGARAWQRTPKPPAEPAPAGPEKKLSPPVTGARVLPRRRRQP